MGIIVQKRKSPYIIVILIPSCRTGMINNKNMIYGGGAGANYSSGHYATTTLFLPATSTGSPASIKPTRASVHPPHGMTTSMLIFQPMMMLEGRASCFIQPEPILVRSELGLRLRALSPSPKTTSTQGFYCDLQPLIYNSLL